MSAFAISSDLDFIALSLDNSIDGIIDLQRRQILHKTDVLSHFSISSMELFTTFCLAGCDDISTQLDGVGWTKALKFAQNYSVSQTDLASQFPKIEIDVCQLI